jgi:hypothetical protein
MGTRDHSDVKETEMTIATKNLNQPDDTVSFPNGGGQIINLDGLLVGRGHLEPGWKWSNDVKPVAGTASCEIAHVGYLLHGHLHVVMDDGTEVDLREGAVYDIPPGHDAWVVGTEPVGTLDWSGNVDRYARPGQ